MHFHPLHLHTLENAAVGLLALGLWLRTEHRADALIEDVLQALLREGGTLEVLHGADLLGHAQALWVGDRSELALLQLLHRPRVLSQVELRAHQDDGRIWTVVAHLGVPLKKK